MKVRDSYEKEVEHLEVTDLLDELEGEEEVQEIEREIEEIDKKLEEIKEKK